MDLLAIGQQLLGSKLGNNGAGIMEAVKGMTGGEGLNLQGLAGLLQENGLSEQVQSWLGDGANQEVSAEQLEQALGQENIELAANKMGVESSEAANSLKDILPELLNNASSGGSITDKFADVGGILNAAKGLLS